MQYLDRPMAQGRAIGPVRKGLRHSAGGYKDLGREAKCVYLDLASIFLEEHVLRSSLESS